MNATTLIATTMLFDSVGHVDDEAVDLFCAQRLSPEDESAVRQHLSVCEECRHRAERENAFRAALADNRDLIDNPPAKVVELPVDYERHRVPKRQRRRSLWVPLASVAAVALAVLLLPRWFDVTRAAPQQEVTLQALRGESRGEASAGHRLRLRLDITGLADRQGLAVQVVNRGGQPIASGVPAFDGAYAVFAVDAPLAAGQYWVRLQRGAESLREYSLPVR